MAGGFFFALMRLLLLGHGRMGRLVESLAPARGFEIVAVLDSTSNAEGAALRQQWTKPIDVAVDFSTAEAVSTNFPLLAERGIDMVIGTTGWHAEELRLRRIAEEHGIGVVASANFSPGVQIFQSLVELAARTLAERPDFGAWLHELHHAAKRDAPSGTARVLLDTMRRAGVETVDVSSTRAGSIPGTHTIGFDSASETITLEHTARDRATFAGGALDAARWIHGRRGWFTIRDVMGLGGRSATSPFPGEAQ
jgi:4-hydroxy-tetrahydrodipicolinate reductase